MGGRKNEKYSTINYYYVFSHMDFLSLRENVIIKLLKFKQRYSSQKKKFKRNEEQK